MLIKIMFATLTIFLLSFKPPNQKLAERIAFKYVNRMPGGSQVQRELNQAFLVYPLHLFEAILHPNVYSASVQKQWQKAKTNYREELGQEVPLPTNE